MPESFFFINHRVAPIRDLKGAGKCNPACRIVRYD
jgi:hypothetical protein